MFRFKWFLAAALAVGTAGLTYTASQVATATESGYDEDYSDEVGDGDKDGKGDKGKGGFGKGKFGKGDKGKFGKGKGGKGDKGKGGKGKGEKKGPPKGDQ